MCISQNSLRRQPFPDSSFEIVQSTRHERVMDSWYPTQPISIVWEQTAPNLNHGYCYWCGYLKQWGDNLSGGHGERPSARTIRRLIQTHEWWDAILWLCTTQTTFLFLYLKIVFSLYFFIMGLVYRGMSMM